MTFSRRGGDKDLEVVLEQTREKLMYDRGGSIGARSREKVAQPLPG
jgi:hypothetical protein